MERRLKTTEGGSRHTRQMAYIVVQEEMTAWPRLVVVVVVGRRGLCRSGGT